MDSAILACALDIGPFAVAAGLQECLKAHIKCIPLVDRLKASLEGLPQFLSRRLHHPSPWAHRHTRLRLFQDLHNILGENHLFGSDHRGVVR